MSDDDDNVEPARMPVMLSVDEYMDVIAAVFFYRMWGSEKLPEGALMVEPEQAERLRLLHVRLRQEVS